MINDALRVTSLHITEDFYEYKGICRLCCGEKSMDLDLVDLSDVKLMQIRTEFCLDDSLENIRNDIMQQVLEAATQQSRQEEGKNCP